jgi:hypothetical protein
MGSRCDGILIAANEAAVTAFPERLLPLTPSMRPPIRVTLVATMLAGHPNVWWLALDGVNRRPLQVECDFASISVTKEALDVPLEWAKHLSLPATFAAARHIAGHVASATYVFHSDGLVGSVAVRFLRSGRTAEWSHGSNAAVAAIQEVLPTVGYVDDFGDALVGGRTLAWRLMDHRTILASPAQLA